MWHSSGQGHDAVVMQRECKGRIEMRHNNTPRGSHEPSPQEVCLECIVCGLTPPKRLPKDKEDWAKCLLSSLPDSERGLLTRVFRNKAKELRIGYMKLVVAFLEDIAQKLQTLVSHVVSMISRTGSLFSFLETKKLLPQH